MSATPRPSRPSGMLQPDLEPAVLHQLPLAYLLGMQGVALFRAFNGEYPREWAEARIAEIRRLLDAADEIGGGIDVPVISTAEARTTGGRPCTTAAQPDVRARAGPRLADPGITPGG